MEGVDTVTEALVRTTAALCERAHRCGPDDGLMDQQFRGPFGGDVRLCQNSWRYALETDTVSNLRAIEARFRARDGRVDREALAKCLKTITQCSLDAAGDGPVSSLDGCEAALVVDAPLPLGAPCADPLSCGEDAFCRSEANACGGVCAEKAPPGGACERGEACRAPAGTPEPHEVACEAEVCVARRIVLEAPAAEGEDCGRIRSAEAVRLTPCAPSLFCRRNPEGCSADPNHPLSCFERGVCRPPLAEGRTCSIWWDVCAEGTMCRCPNGTDDCETTTCRPTSPPPAVTAAQAFQPLSEGDTCVPEAERETDDEDALGGADWRFCDRGLFCEPDRRRCRRLLEDGAACDPDLDKQCAGSCDPDTLECGPWCGL